jgi:alkylhydroperoxidase/carboxymuconolactone decarboxylase family protein YurZ
MSSNAEAFNVYREKMNARILDADNLVIKRFFNLDTQAYLPGALDVKTKEMLGLVASLVLRCDDCIRYHLLRSFPSALW